MKRCKYCKKPGQYNHLLSKVLCENHADVYLNLRSVWNAIADLQLEAGRR